MLFYEVFGNSSADHPFPLIFLHGFLGSHLDWMPIIKELQTSYCCIAIDLPSHGKSISSSDVFLSLETALLALSTPPPMLIGYSLGGRLAFSYGKKHPEKIKGLISISAHTGLTNALEKEKRMNADLLWQTRLETFSSEDFLTLWYQQPVFASLQKRPELLERLLKPRSYQHPKELAAILAQASLAKQPLYDAFAHPIYFLFGEEDLAYARLYGLKPTHLVKKIEQAGHALHIENPLACIEAIRLFS